MGSGVITAIWPNRTTDTMTNVRAKDLIDDISPTELRPAEKSYSNGATLDIAIVRYLM